MQLEEWKHCSERTEWRVDRCGAGVLLCLWHRDGRAFGIIKAVHRAQLHDHVQAVGEHQDHEQTGDQTHPDPWGEEAGAVAGIREFTTAHVKALNLTARRRRGSKCGVCFSSNSHNRPEISLTYSYVYK